MINKIFSIIFGLLLGITISYILFININYKIKGPDSNKIKKYVYQFGDEYYRFKTIICIKPYFM